jgi:hypothetical protein
MALQPVPPETTSSEGSGAFMDDYGRGAVRALPSRWTWCVSPYLQEHVATSHWLTMSEELQEQIAEEIQSTLGPVVDELIVEYIAGAFIGNILIC